MKRRPRRPGLDVIPGRIRRARLDSGLTLGDLAEGRVSRAFIHLVERGRSRPSREVLEHIALRTGKPMSYFMTDKEGDDALSDLPRALFNTSRRVRRVIATSKLEGSELKALQLIDSLLRSGAQFAKSLVG